MFNKFRSTSNQSKGTFPMHSIYAEPGGFNKRQRIDYKAIGLLAVTGLAVIGIGIWYGQEILNPKPAPCDASVVPNTHVVALIDLSDRLDDRVIGAVRTKLEGYQQRLQAGDWLSLVTLTPDPEKDTVTRTYFQTCKLPDGTRVNAWTGNQKIVGERYQKNYLQAVNVALTGLSQFKAAETADSSPLLRAVYEMTQMDKFSSKVPNRILLLVGDMLEHSEECSFFKAGCNLERLADNFYVKGVLGRLAGSTVELIKVQNRYQHRQTTAFEAFWEDYFKNHAGAEAYHQASLMLKEGPPEQQRASGQWVVQVAAFRDDRAAQRLNDRLVSGGYRVFSQQQDQWTVVYVGPEESQRAAVLTLTLLKTDFQLEGRVTRL